MELYQFSLDEDAMLEILNNVAAAVNSMGLKFKLKKCVILHGFYHRRREVLPTIFTFQRCNPTLLGDGDEYKHLEVPMGIRSPRFDTVNRGGRTEDRRVPARALAKLKITKSVFSPRDF